MPSPGLGIKRIDRDNEAPIPVQRIAMIRTNSCIENCSGFVELDAKLGNKFEKRFINRVNTMLRGI